MEWRLLWFILAGFILGFATSTLWEWLYYRRLRLRAVEGATVRAPMEPPPTVIDEQRSPVTTVWGNADYRSPAVFLEGETHERAVGSPTRPEGATYEP